jgi:peptidoglycan/xylan/chitin deacetylase (PgdA/CDA1 family)
MIRQTIIRVCDVIDSAVTYPLFGDATPSGSSAGTVTALLFHRLYHASELTRDDGGFRHERVRLEEFEEIVSRFARAGYVFVTPRDMLMGRHIGQRAAMITFDDGYADNLRALPVLERYDANAVIFVSPGPLVRREAFWWDVVHREAAKRRIAPAEIARMVHHMRNYDFPRLQETIHDLFGQDAFAGNYEADRPMNEVELERVVASGRVEIGNHTYDHAALAQGPEEARRQVEMAQRELLRLTGEMPVSFSFPHGLYSDMAIDVVAQAGLKFAANVDYRLNVLRNGATQAVAIDNPMMRISRIPIFGGRSLKGQFASSCARVSSGRAVAATAKSLGRLSKRMRPARSAA